MKKTAIAEKLREQLLELPITVDVIWIAEALCCSKRHVENLITSGRIPSPIRLSRLRRWPRKLILQWIELGCPSAEKFEQAENETD